MGDTPTEVGRGQREGAWGAHGCRAPLTVRAWTGACRHLAHGARHAILAAPTLEVFTWGSNKGGQLGSAGEPMQPEPRPCAHFNRRVVRQATQPPSILPP